MQGQTEGDGEPVHPQGGDLVLGHAAAGQEGDGGVGAVGGDGRLLKVGAAAGDGPHGGAAGVLQPLLPEEVVEQLFVMFAVLFAGEPKDVFWLCPKLVQFLLKY